MYTDPTGNYPAPNPEGTNHGENNHGTPPWSSPDTRGRWYPGYSSNVGPSFEQYMGSIGYTYVQNQFGIGAWASSNELKTFSGPNAFSDALIFAGLNEHTAGIFSTFSNGTFSDLARTFKWYSWEGISNSTIAGNGYVMVSKRIAESPNSTLSEFSAYGPIPLSPVSGYVLEPRGPSTTSRNQDKRVPGGLYDVKHYVSQIKDSPYKNHYIIWNSEVPLDRYILIHGGSQHGNTEGCLIIGDSYSFAAGDYVVGNWKPQLNRLRQLLGQNASQLYIIDY